MTGYNHYPSCTCGWCVNNGRSRLDPNQLRDQLQLRDAKTFLERNSVTSIAACYIDPNARCPVCSGPVYFYANQFGSRVYFDHLGPPWPKHPCTDNPRKRIEFQAKPGKSPTRRPLGLMQELVANANTAGILRGKIFGQRDPKDWTLLIITSAERRAEENFVEAEFLDSLKCETSKFRCFSSISIFQVGDFVSQKGEEFSFLYPHNLIPITFLAGSRISMPQDDDIPRNSVLLHRRARPTAKPIGPIPEERRGSAPKVRIGKRERAHYQSKSLTMEEFCSRLRPVIKKFAREGTRKPRDVAIRLNFAKIKSASGASWTPRLVYILLSHLFESTPAKHGSVRGMM